MLVNDDNVDDHKDNKCFERNNKKKCQKNNVCKPHILIHKKKHSLSLKSLVLQHNFFT